MKVFVRVLSVSFVVALIAGCASDVAYVPTVPPRAQAKLLDYNKQPENKVFVIAVDPCGDFSFGYDYGKPTIKEASKIALEKCDAGREALGVNAASYIYAINDKVVYEEQIQKASQSKGNAAGNVQEDVARQVATAEADQPSG